MTPIISPRFNPQIGVVDRQRIAKPPAQVHEFQHDRFAGPSKYRAGKPGSGRGGIIKR